MSDVVEKTLTALPSLLSLDSQPGSSKLSSSSKLGSLIRGITELTSKHEEEKLIEAELTSIKEQVSSPHTSMRQMKELMVRAIYCEMLGYDASFAYIHAIKLAQQGSALEKRVGYLAVSLFLNEGHELLLLLVNTVLKDLQSTNLIEVCMALTVVSQIFPKDMIPAVLPLVEEKLNNPKEIIRRKAVLALYKFYLIAPTQVQHIHNKFRKALCDKDPGVMTASLHIYVQMIEENPEGYKDLTSSIVTILKQVLGGKLPMDFNYHSVPAPWLQMQLLRILALLGKNDQRTSELMYEVLDESLQRAEMNHNITYGTSRLLLRHFMFNRFHTSCWFYPLISPAILYECVRCIYTVYPKSDLLEKAAKCIGNFVLSPKINLKYLGLKALTYVVQQDPKLALQHQMTIIECLDHTDLIIKRETLELLFRITNSQNVTVIVEKMLEFLRSSKDDYTTADLVGKVLGEYCHLKEDLEPATVLKLMANLLDLKTTSSETKTWVLLAMTKLCGSSSRDVSVVREVCETFSSSLDTVLRQRAQELQHLSQDPHLRARVLPRESSREPLEVDSSLSFLDEFVSEALAAGAAPYKPPHQRQEELSDSKALSLEPYGLSLPISLSSCSMADRQSPTLLSVSSDLSGNSTDRSHKGGSTSLNLDGVRRVWGKDGYLVKRDPVEEAGQVEVPDLHLSPSPEAKAAASHSQTPPSKASPEPEPEKQQLASSLFVGLASHSSVSLMGKTEENPHRFRRKAKASDPSQEGMSNSAFSSSSSVDNFLCENLLDPESATSSPSQTSRLPRSLSATNGTCDVEGANSSPAADGGVSEGTDSGRQEEQPTPKDGCLSSHFPAELRGLPCSEITPLSSNQSLDLSACHVQKEDALILLLFIHNCSSSDLQQTCVQLHSEELEVSSCDGVMQELRGRTVTVCQSLLSVKRPSVQVEVGGVVSCTLPVGTPLSLQFSYNLPLTSFIRPLAVSTEEYGKMWLDFSHDTKQNLKVMGDGLADTLQVLTNKLQLHVVEIIGMEGIVACQLLQNQPCLLHCRLHAGALAVWLRSPVPELPDCLLYHCQRALNEH
ncbi:unnamed protein product [Tetraodon nigroviridis]|uniref:AP-4 complex subunit epsilon n=1 Tax=Tetraodon nigroviridis TaxID=99883 RepID=Q4S1E4_TETNG|nr:unnamed protein product [Tetraodon nigroviridis]